MTICVGQDCPWHSPSQPDHRLTAAAACRRPLWSTPCTSCASAHLAPRSRSPASTTSPTSTCPTSSTTSTRSSSAVAGWTAFGRQWRSVRPPGGCSGSPGERVGRADRPTAPDPVHRPELPRPRRRDRSGRAGRADPVHQVAEHAGRPVRRRADPARVDQAGLGGGARHRDRPADQLPGLSRGGPRRDRRLPGRQRRQRAGVPDRARRPVEQGQVRRDLQPGRTVAGHPRRDRRRPRAGHVAGRQRRPPADRQHRDDGLRPVLRRALPEPVPGPGARRPDQHRHAARRRHGLHSADLAAAGRRDGARHRGSGQCSGRTCSLHGDQDNAGLRPHRTRRGRRCRRCPAPVADPR